MIQNYLSKRKQRVKIGSSLSEWLEIILGVPQGSKFGPILFNIFINDLLLLIKETDVCNFADDTTLYKRESDLDIVLANLEMDSNIAINGLNNNKMVANPKKFQLMFLAKNKSIEKEMSFVGKATKFSSTVELLGITLDKNFNFKSHIENICCKANNKIKVLFQIQNFLALEQAKVLAEAYILSNFRYCPLVWMFCGRRSYNLIMKTHYRCLRAIYNT